VGAKVQATLLSGSTATPLTIVARNIGTASEMALIYPYRAMLA
jgi:hypothetical protein